MKEVILIEGLEIKKVHTGQNHLQVVESLGPTWHDNPQDSIGPKILTLPIKKLSYYRPHEGFVEHNFAFHTDVLNKFPPELVRSVEQAFENHNRSMRMEEVLRKKIDDLAGRANDFASLPWYKRVWQALWLPYNKQK